MSSSEKALRKVARALIDNIDPDVWEFPWRWFSEVKAVKDTLEATSDKTDLQRLVGWLYSRWGDYDAAGPDDQARRFAIDEVLQHIADEFGVMGGKEKTDERS